MNYAGKEMIGQREAQVRKFGIIILLGAAIGALLAAYLTSPQLKVRGATQSSRSPAATNQDWPVYGGDANDDRYSPLTQIDRQNVKQLRIAWRVDVGTEGGLQDNPLMVGRTIFVYSPSEEILALDAATGNKLWSFDSGVKATQPSRGFSYWTDGKQSILFAGVMDHLYALDPATGKPTPGFGDGGSVDLRKDLGNEDFASNFAVLTSPGAIYKDMIIVGFRAPETHPAPHGDIRAYDVHSGKLRWSFHTIPHPSEPGYETWPKDAWKTAGAANNWPGMVIDQQRGIVFAPTGSAVDDFYGADRVGNDLYANTLLALDANTGKLIWHFQGVHHDIWDRDFPSPPVLVTVQRDGKPIDAVAQTSKQGFVYLFERTTGKPLFPLEERPYPASTVPGEVASPTQSLPLVPAPFARQLLTSDMLTNRTPEAHAWAVEQFSKFRSEGQFIPFSVDKETIIFPGYDGGAEWGGPAVDPHRAIIYINANDIGWTGGLAKNQTGGPGFTLFQSQCALCHGADRKGSPPQFPSLLGISDRLSDAAIVSTIHTGKGRMSAFPNIQGESLKALIEYLHTGPGSESITSGRADDKVEAAPAAKTSGESLKYHFTGYKKFLDPDGYPAIVPPWGTLNAIDLNTGKYLWKIPFGQYPELAAKGMTQTGSENYGGPILTASGVLIIGATNFDRKLRAYNSDTGALLWEADLPFAGNATPATYMVDGKQYIVIATSGVRDKKGPQGAAYVAFALP
jgi:quinoprotein glucose dehydrogenase